MRGHLTKKGERWYAVVSLKATANRKRRQRWIRLNARTKRGAETGLAKIVVQVEDRGLPENTKTTIAAHLDYWFGISAPKFSGKTRQRFAAIIGSYLKPTLGEIQLSKLSTQLVDEAYADWEKTGNKTEGLRKNGSKWRSAAAGTGLSPASIHAIHHVLHAALEFAVAKDLILKNVAAKAELPDLEHREMAVLNEQEVAQLLEAAYGSHLYVPVFLAVNTAVRRGELLGLRWADVDFERRQLTVRRSLEELKGALSFKSPKTDEARSIRLDDYTTALLKKHRAEQIELRLGLGLGHSGSDLVFAGPRGEP